MIESAGKRAPISGLDLIRFFAAFAVMVYHLAFWSWAAPYSTQAMQILGGTPVSKIYASWPGAVGVDMFFVLSGFVIIYSASRDARSFARSRVLRLVPAAMVSATISVGVLAWAGLPLPSTYERYIATLFFWPLGPWIDGVYWTLGIEVAFYSSIFVLIRYTSIERLRLVLYPLALASSLFWLLSLGFGLRAWVEASSAPNVVRMLRLGLLYDGNLFALGGLIWANFYSRGKYDWVVMTLCALTAPIHIGEDQAWQAAKAGSTVAAPIILWLACVAAIFLSVRFNDQISKVVPGRLARNVGIATYPLYLLHNTVGPAVIRVAFGITGSATAAVMLALTACCVLAFAVAALAEPPLRRLIASAFDRAWRVRAEAAPAPAFATPAPPAGTV
jgi:peptidoglycan/LPS O-acetylase OafA/YrhL